VASIGLSGRFAEALAFLPAIGVCSLGDDGLVDLNSSTSKPN